MRSCLQALPNLFQTPVPLDDNSSYKPFYTVFCIGLKLILKPHCLQKKKKKTECRVSGPVIDESCFFFVCVVQKVFSYSRLMNTVFKISECFGRYVAVKALSNINLLSSDRQSNRLQDKLLVGLTVMAHQRRSSSRHPGYPRALVALSWHPAYLNLAMVASTAL